MAHTALVLGDQLSRVNPALEGADAREGGVPLQSAEGFVRQVIGWREYVWGMYMARMGDAEREGIRRRARDAREEAAGRA